MTVFDRILKLLAAFLAGAAGVWLARAIARKLRLLKNPNPIEDVMSVTGFIWLSRIKVNGTSVTRGYEDGLRGFLRANGKKQVRRARIVINGERVDYPIQESFLQVIIPGSPSLTLTKWCASLLLEAVTPHIS